MNVAFDFHFQLGLKIKDFRKYEKLRIFGPQNPKIEEYNNRFDAKLPSILKKSNRMEPPVGKVPVLNMDNIILEGNRIKYRKRAFTGVSHMSLDRYKGRFVFRVFWNK